MYWNKVTLVGVGLLGGSLGLALRRGGLARRVCGLVRRSVSVKETLDLGLTDESTLDPDNAMEGCDLLVLCTPVSTMKSLVLDLFPRLNKGAFITDVGSVKGSVIADVESLALQYGLHFLGSHPMAGSEASGAAASREDLFRSATTVITPTPHTCPTAIEKIRATWEAVGSRVLEMSAEHHDILVARSSHLPHIVASELARYVLNPSHPPEQAALCATGFRDTTRVASGSPEMWKDIVMANRQNLVQMIDDLIQDFKSIQTAIEQGDQEAIHDFFETAKQRRDHLFHSNQGIQQSIS